MKRLCALLLVCCLLAGCAGVADAADAEPAWQAELAGGGTLTVSGCTVTQTTADYLPAADAAPVTLPLLRTEGVPTLTFTGVTEEDIVLDYAEPAGESYIRYEAKFPIDKLDYVFTRGEDGTLTYRLDTVYSYCLTVGEEQWLLSVHREGI